jgi:heptaprenyl diphosphate synthase/octaprenyl-diphosphate synthase
MQVETVLPRMAGGAAPAAQVVQPGLSEILGRAGMYDDMAAIETLLVERTASRSPLIAAAGAHIFAAGGKRLRAALVLLAAQLGVYAFARAAHPAVAVELLHAASLVHDDLVDHALQRRGRVTVHARWDNDVALMLGDYFFGLAANELAHEPDPRIIQFYTGAAQTMVEGELNPVVQLVPTDVARAQYFRKIGAKTAALFAAACKAGIAVAGGNDEQTDAVGRFGYELGLAFQIVDDVLDYTGDELILGKPAGNDLREGTLTLPLIYAVERSRDPLLAAVAREPRVEAAQVPQVVAAVIAAGGAARALDEARELLLRASGHLAIFPPSTARRALDEIAQFIVERER